MLVYVMPDSKLKKTANFGLSLPLKTLCGIRNTKIASAGLSGLPPATFDFDKVKRHRRSVMRKMSARRFFAAAYPPLSSRAAPERDAKAALRLSG